MIFRNHEKQYIVIRKLESAGEGQAEQYLCRDLDHPSQEEYRILSIPQDHAAASMPFLIETENCREFTDFTEYFFDGPTLYLVFREAGGKTLAEKLQTENCSFLERLTIGQQLLQRIILLNPPVFYQAAAMDIRSIHVAETGDITFSYALDNWYQAAELRFEQVELQFAEVLRYLFQRELAAGKFPDLLQYLQRLQQGEWKDMIALYRDYQTIYENWKDVPDRDLLPKTLAENVEGLLDKGKKGLRIIAAVLLVLAAAGYLGFSIWRMMKPDAQAQNFSQIGTLVLATEETETE